jgi:protein gp37
LGEKSAIEWTDATWNPVTGCTKISPGCKFCYAERITERWGRGKFTDVTLHPDRLELPLRWRNPRRIFVNSMSDLFHERVPLSFVDEVFRVMTRAEQHIFQVLTKRPDRALEWQDSCPDFVIPHHAWVGVSVESAAYLWRVDRLRLLRAAVRFISAEPLLGPLTGLDLKDISWLITGGESGGTRGRALVARTELGWCPKPEALAWVREIRDVCQTAGVAFFHKQWGGPTPKSGGRLLDQQTWDNMPTMPEAESMPA